MNLSTHRHCAQLALMTTLLILGYHGSGCGTSAGDTKGVNSSTGAITDATTESPMSNGTAIATEPNGTLGTGTPTEPP